jgi:hypothetical protein
MTITLTDKDNVERIDTGSHLHGSIKPGPYDAARVTQRWFGAVGEVILTGKLSGRDLTCWLQLTGYSSHANLHAGIVTLNDEINAAGTLDVHGLQFLNVIFNGFTPEEDPWLDGSGVNGWNCKGILSFRQVKS